MDPSSYESLNKLIEEFDPFNRLWKNCHEFDMEKTSCYNDPFLKLNFTRIDKKIQEFQRSSIQLIKQLDDIANDSAQGIASEFKKDIEGFKEKLWLIELLTT